MNNDVPLTFEQAHTRLEQTLEEMRKDALPLDRALRLYEQGTMLATYCDELLQAAELRVTQLETEAKDTGSIVREASAVFVTETELI